MDDLIRLCDIRKMKTELEISKIQKTLDELSDILQQQINKYNKIFSNKQLFQLKIKELLKTTLVKRDFFYSNTAKITAFDKQIHKALKKKNKIMEQIREQEVLLDREKLILRTLIVKKEKYNYMIDYYNEECE